MRNKNQNELSPDFKMEEIVRTWFENGRVAVSEGGRGERPRCADAPNNGQSRTFPREISAAQHLGGRDFHATV